MKTQHSGVDAYNRPNMVGCYTVEKFGVSKWTQGEHFVFCRTDDLKTARRMARKHASVFPYRTLVSDIEGNEV